MPRGKNVKLIAERNLIEQRLQIVAPLWRRNWTLQEIRQEVMKRLELPTYSLSTCHTDVKRLIKEWQSCRMKDTEAKITGELARLDLVIREAWEAWEKSKEDYHKKTQSQEGLPNKDSQGVLVGINTVKAMMYDSEERGFGEPRYLAIVLKAMEQRCKLMGLDKTVLDVQAGIQGNIEIRYVDAGVPCATSEDEVMRREGLIDTT